MPPTAAIERPNVNAEPEHLLWAEHIRTTAETWRGAMPEEAYPISALAFVRAGAPIGRCEPPAGSASGHAEPLQLGAGVRRSEDDHATLIAEVDGRVVLNRLGVSVVPAFRIDGDVRPEAGTVSADSALWIAGRITEGSAVRASGVACVRGTVEGARIDVRESIYILEGINGRRKGVIQALEDVSAKYATDGLIASGKNLYIKTSLSRCQSCVAGRFFGRTAQIAGGATLVGGHAVVGTIGAEDGTATQLSAGINASSTYELLRAYRRIDNMRRMVAHLRQITEPLHAERSRLRTEQRQSLRSSIARLAHAEREIESEQRRCAGLLEQVFDADAAVIDIVRGVLPNTAISIQDRLAIIQWPIRGPVRIELRRRGRDVEMLLVNRAGTVLKPLPAERVGVAEVIRGVDVSGYPLDVSAR